MTKEAQILVEENHNLIYSYLKEMRLNVDEYYDLAAIGLCKAAIIFDKSFGYQFSTLAYFCMRNEVLQEMRHTGKGVTPLLIIDDEEKGLDSVLTDNFESVEDITMLKLHVQSFLKRASPLQRDIIHLVASGYSQTEIARMLHVSQTKISRSLIKFRLIKEEGEEYE